MLGIDGIAEHLGHHQRLWLAGTNGGVERARSLIEQCRAVRAYRAEQLRIAEGNAQCAVSTHGHAFNAARLTCRLDAVLTFNEGHEFLQEEVAVTFLAVGRVHVKAAAALRRHDNEIADLLLLAQVLDQGPRSTVDQCLLVVAAACGYGTTGGAVALHFVQRRGRWELRLQTVEQRLEVIGVGVGKRPTGQ